MTQTIAIIVNSALALGLLGALALVVRLAHRLPVTPGRETLHPSQPLELSLLRAEDEETELARVA
jgi:hypothetical protein